MTHLSLRPCCERHTEGWSSGALVGPRVSASVPLRPTGERREQRGKEETGWHTNPDAQLDVLPSIDVHARVEQAELTKVVAVGHEGAANHGGSPTTGESTTI